MTGTHRTAGICAGCALAVLVGLALPARAADSREPISQQQAKQRHIRQDTDHMVRRASAMLRVLDYYRMDESAEKRILDEVASTLSGLSKEEMAEVIARLDKALKASDEQQSREEVDEAYRQHRVVLDRLRALLARYEAIKSLDQAAVRLEKASKDQLELHLRSSQLFQEWFESADWPTGPNKRLRPAVMSDIEHEGDEQDDVGRDVVGVFTQLGRLKDHLPAEQKDRLGRAEVFAGDQQLFDNLAKATARMLTPGAPNVPKHLQFRRGRRSFVRVHTPVNPTVLQQSWTSAGTLQRQSAADLQELARILRTPQDRLAALREAREQVVRAIQKQETLRQESAVQKDPRVQDMEMQRQQQGLPRQTQELSEQQGRLEHATHGTENLLKPHAPEVAAKISPAEKAMREAEQALRKNTPDNAVKPQQQAADKLRAVRKDLDKMIATAEKQQHDALAALQKTAETVDRLLKEQKDLRGKAHEAEAAKQPERLPHLTAKQQDLAKRTDHLNQQPTAAKPEARDALDKAAKAMDKAAESLEDKKGSEAVAKQDKAIKSLEKAKKALDDQVAAVQKRRDDIAALEDAGKRLAELAKKENKVADQARDLDHKKGEEGKKDEAAKELSRQQGDLTPQAKDVGKQVEAAAPEAAKKVDEGAKHMDAAKGDIDKKELSPAAKHADKAADKLKDAEKAVAKALDDKKGEEIADQAAMQPKDVDPENAAQQLAKAIEHAKHAAEQSDKAAAKSGQKSKDSKAAKPNLAKLQKQVADKATKLKLEKAAKPADKAADALEKGELEAAIGQQKEALAKLEDAAQKEDEAAEQGKPEAKEGDKGEQAHKGDEANKHEEGHKGEQAHKGEQGEKKAEQGHKGDESHKGEQGHKGEEGHKGDEGHKDKQGHKGDEGDKGEEGQEAGEQGDKAEQGHEGSPHGGQPKPSEAKNAAELAQAQKALLEATRALAKSQEATQEAKAALEQAQAQAPEQVQPPLQEAGKELSQAGQQLHQGEPAPANESQNQAVAHMSKALQSLNAALAAMGKPGAHPGQKPEALASAAHAGQKPGQEPGQKPGQKPGQAKSQKRGPGQEQRGRGNGNRLANAVRKNAPSSLMDVIGGGAFLHLPPRQREMIKQALNEKLPPEYAGLIQQYYVNIARGKPASKPVTPDKR
ncbi:MAG TPA: hypothetical protein VG013_22805 [Gemmataceae bacterium]|nr:hypothetical protein [Gemmataceae bacterium]